MSSIQFLVHTDWKINDLNPIWVRLLGRSQLSNHSVLPCLQINTCYSCWLINVGHEYSYENTWYTCNLLVFFFLTLSLFILYSHIWSWGLKNLYLLVHLGIWGLCSIIMLDKTHYSIKWHGTIFTASRLLRWWWPFLVQGESWETSYRLSHCI